MADGNTMRLEITLEQEQAMETMRRFTQALRDAEEQAGRTSAAIDAIGTAADRAGSAGQTVGAALGRASGGLGLAGAVAGVAAVQFNTVATSIETTTVNLTNLTQKTTAAGSAAGNAATSVLAWVGAHAGFDAVIRMVDSYLEKLRAVDEAQRKLLEIKHGDDAGNLMTVMRNLSLNGSAGETTARKLIDDLTKRAPVSREGAAGSLAVTNAAGFDPRTGPGMAYAEALANAWGPMQLDDQTATQLARFASTAGVKSAEDMNRLLGQFRASFGASLSTSLSAYLRGDVAGAVPEITKGVDPTQAMAMFSALTSGRGTERAAGASERMIFDLVGSRVAKTRGYLADEAARLGVTSPVPVDTAEVLADGTDPEVQKIAGLRQQLDAARDGQAAAGHHLNDPGRHTATAAQRAERVKAYEEAQTRVAKLEREVDAATAKAVAAARTRANLAAYEKLPLMERVERVLVPAAQAAAGSPEARDAFAASVGSAPTADAAMLFASKQAEYQRVLAATRGATAEDTVRANRDFEATREAQYTRTQAAAAGIEVTRNPGAEYAARLAVVAAAKQLDNVQNSVYTSDSKTGYADRVKNLIGNESRQIADEAEKILRKEMAEAVAKYETGDHTPAQRAMTQQISGQVAELNRDLSGPAGLVTSSRSYNIGRVAEAFGTTRQSLLEAEVARLNSTNRPAPAGGYKTKFGVDRRTDYPNTAGGSATPAEVAAYRARVRAEMQTAADELHGFDTADEGQVREILSLMDMDAGKGDANGQMMSLYVAEQRFRGVVGGAKAPAPATGTGAATAPAGHAAHGPLGPPAPADLGQQHAAATVTNHYNTYHQNQYSSLNVGSMYVPGEVDVLDFADPLERAGYS